MNAKSLPGGPPVGGTASGLTPERRGMDVEYTTWLRLLPLLIARRARPEIVVVPALRQVRQKRFRRAERVVHVAIDEALRRS